MKLWKKNYIGVDISATRVKVAQLKMDKGTPVIEQLAKKALNAPLSSMGVDELAIVLKEVLTGFNYKNGVITASLPAEELILKLVPVPVMDEEELETAMYFEATTMVIGEPDQWVIRHIPLYTEADSMVILLIAAPRHLTLLLYEAFKAAGIKLQGIDVHPFAQFRASKMWLDSTGSCNAVLNIDAKSGQLIVVNQGYIKFARILAVNTENIASELVRSLELYNFQPSFPVQQLYITGDFEENYLNLDLGIPVKRGAVAEELLQLELENRHQLSGYSMAVGLAMGDN